jgi:hypothetical protein
MIDKFAITIGEVSSGFLDLNRTSSRTSTASFVMPAPVGTGTEFRRTQASGH